MKKLFTLLLTFFVLILVGCTNPNQALIDSLRQPETQPPVTETEEEEENDLVIYEPVVKVDGKWHMWPEGYSLIVIPYVMLQEVYYNIDELAVEDFVFAGPSDVLYYRYTDTVVIFIIKTNNDGVTGTVILPLSENMYIWGIEVDDASTDGE